MEEEDYYAILEVSPDASQEKIKAQYRILMRLVHPDKHSSDPELKKYGEAKAKKFNEAYDVLGDARKRAEYDRLRAASGQVLSSSATPKPSPGQQGRKESGQTAQRVGEDHPPARTKAASSTGETNYSTSPQQTYRTAQPTRARKQSPTVSPALISLVLVAFICLCSFAYIASFNSEQVQPQRQVVPTDTQIPNTATPRPTSTPRPVVTETVDTGINYTIQQISTGTRGVELILDAPSDFPFTQQGFELQTLVQDITGNWQFDDSMYPVSLTFQPRGVFVSRQQQSPTDAFETDDIAAGHYLLVQGGEYWRLHLRGWWGNETLGTSGQYHGLVVPVREGWMTRVTIRIGKLEIGVLNADGTEALPGMEVTLRCQGEDIAGNVIPDADCDMQYLDTSIEDTDATGVAMFYVGPGTYYAEIDTHSFTESLFLYDIEVASGEEKRLVANFTG